MCEQNRCGLFTIRVIATLYLSSDLLSDDWIAQVDPRYHLQRDGLAGQLVAIEQSASFVQLQDPLEIVTAVPFIAFYGPPKK